MTQTSPSFEEEFESCAAGSRLGFERARIYDSEYGLFHSTGRRVCEDVEPGPAKGPDKAWVADAFRAMVVGEGTRKGLRRAVPRVDRAFDTTRYEIESFPIARYIEACEEEYVFGGRAENIVGSPSTPKLDRFLNVVRDPFLGSTTNRQNVDQSVFASAFAHADDAKAPIQLLLPAMPFKDQCVFRTACPPDHIDLGEIAFLVRLHCLALAINQLHQYDCECIVVSDGLVYAEMFGVTRDNATRYLEYLRDARDRLNLSKSVHIVDLETLITRDDDGRRAWGLPSSRRIRASIRTTLKSLLPADPAIMNIFHRLVAGMRWNVNTRVLVDADEVDLAAVWRWLRSPAGSSFADDAVARRLEAVAATAAIEYASFNLALAYSGILRRHFPAAVRLTSHAKSGQVMAPRLGSVFPWNGVAVASALDTDSIKASSIRSAELHTVVGDRLVPVYERNGRFPICYTERGIR